MSMWDRGTAALATLRAAPQTGHLGRGAGLIDEHQSAGIEIGLAFEPGQPARGDVRALLLGGVRVFFKADPMAIEEPPHRAGPDRQVALFQQRLQLGECDVRRLLHLGQQERGRALDPSRPPVTASRIGRGAAPSGATHQPNGWRSTRSRRTVPPHHDVTTRLDCLNHPDAQILGKIVRHPYWPPSPASILNHIEDQMDIP